MRQALSFLTPLGGARAPSPSALPWFPLAGLVIGGALGGIWWGAAGIWPPTVAAAVVVACDLGLTGMLHFDGLVDSADGLLPHLSRERRLEVMAAPDVGAFGLAVGGASLLVRWSSLAAIHPRGFHKVLLLGGLWCVSRSAMAVIALVIPYARTEGGLASAFLAVTAPARPMLIGAGGLAVGMALAGPGAALAAAAAAGLVAALGWRKLGGFTGDLLGAAGVVAETVGLLIAAARW